MTHGDAALDLTSVHARGAARGDAASVAWLVERLSPLLFAAAGQAFRLRVFTVNHPGYDVPAGAAIDRYHLEAYSIRHQPRAMRAP